MIQLRFLLLAFGRWRLGVADLAHGRYILGLVLLLTVDFELWFKFTALPYGHSNSFRTSIPRASRFVEGCHRWGPK